MNGAPSWLREVPLAHRGLHGPDRPENSLAAFAAAAAAGVGVELDVQRTLDGIPIVFHDHDLDRLTGWSGRVADARWAELEALALADTDHGIPTLADALGVLQDVPVMVEIKNVDRRAGPLEPAVAAMLSRHDGPACVAGFNPATIGWFARNAEHLVRVQTAGPLAEVAMPAPVRWSLRSLRFLALTRPHAVSYDLAGIDHPAVQAFRATGGTVIAWTVRSLEDLTRAREYADNVIFEGLDHAVVRSHEQAASGGDGHT